MCRNREASPAGFDTMDLIELMELPEDPKEINRLNQFDRIKGFHPILASLLVLKSSLGQGCPQYVSDMLETAASEIGKIMKGLSAQMSIEEEQEREVVCLVHNMIHALLAIAKAEHCLNNSYRGHKLLLWLLCEKLRMVILIDYLNYLDIEREMVQNVMLENYFDGEE